MEPATLMHEGTLLAGQGLFDFHNQQLPLARKIAFDMVGMVTTITILSLDQISSRYVSLLILSFISQKMTLF